MEVASFKKKMEVADGAPSSAFSKRRRTFASDSPMYFDLAIIFRTKRHVIEGTYYGFSGKPATLITMNVNVFKIGIL